MKKRNFLSLFLVFSLIISTLFLNSCETPEDCETYDYATVTVQNQTGYSLCVDVTWGSSEYNDERWLSPGYETTYYEVPTGTIYMWSSYGEGHGWVKKTTSVFACEELTYTWYNGKKSMNDIELRIYRNGDLINTITDLNFVLNKNIQ